MIHEKKFHEKRPVFHEDFRLMNNFHENFLRCRPTKSPMNIRERYWCFALHREYFSPFRGLSLFDWRHALPHSLAACRSRTSTTAVAILETSKVNSMIKRLKLSDDPQHCEVSGACRARTCTGQIEKKRSRLKDFRPTPPDFARGASENLDVHWGSSTPWNT